MVFLHKHHTRRKMASFVIRCPQCAAESKDVYLNVSSGLFAKRNVTCPNGHNINVKADRMAMRVCPHCGNNVMYDQKKAIPQYVRSVKQRLTHWKIMWL